jgi:hypothetical protein
MEHGISVSLTNYFVLNHAHRWEYCNYICSY